MQIRKPARCPEASSGVQSVTAGKNYPYETSHCYIEIDERHREQEDFVALSLTERTVLILAQKMWLLSKSSLTFKGGFAAPAESLLAYPPCFWPVPA